MRIKIEYINFSPDQPEASLADVLKTRYGLSAPFTWKIVRKSLDARKKDRIHYRYAVVLEIEETEARRLLKEDDISIYQEAEPFVPPKLPKTAPLVIVGSGPAGLFCALRLMAYGLHVIILEQGKPVETRMRDIARLEATGLLDERSNVLFGEGGAGTYSDGKLTTRTNRPESRWFFEKMLDFGAPPEIFYHSKPHIGTDNLRRVIPNIREYILKNGSTIEFNCEVSRILFRDGRAAGVVTADGREFLSPHIVMATGHSARHTYEMLFRQGVALGKKGFAVGCRVEHPEEMIREIQYGSSPFKQTLPSPEYRLAWNNKATGRGIYSFCMCPGGMVVNSSSEAGLLCINGMSYSKRNMPRSNAALVVTVSPNDIQGDALAGIEFQREIERVAYRTGGEGFKAPAQRVIDFMERKISTALPESSYRPAVASADIHRILPPWICAELAAALPHFNRKMKGFVSSEALLIGVETRTSSPVRITRNKGFESVSHKGLYPAGEGSGYAGGIVSSAVDGIRVADVIAAEMLR